MSKATRDSKRALAFLALLLVPWLAYAKSLHPGSVRIAKQTVRLQNWKDREAVIHYPTVKGSLDDTLRHRIEEAIGLKAGTDMTLEEWKADNEESRWLSEIDYEIKHNQNSILNLVYTVSGVGAYPDSFSKSLVVDLRTGNPLTAADLFKSSSLNALATRLNTALNADVEKARRKWGADWESMEEELKDARFDAAKLDDLTIGDKGVTFHFDFNFPHVVEAMEPSGRYFVGWKELEPYIDRQGPLGVFLRPCPQEANIHDRSDLQPHLRNLSQGGRLAGREGHRVPLPRLRQGPADRGRDPRCPRPPRPPSSGRAPHQGPRLPAIGPYRR